MATKTISLEIDAYDKLRAAKQSERESFSSVVRRAKFPAASHTGASVLEHITSLGTHSAASSAVIEYWEAMRREDQERPRVSGNKWEEADAS